MFGSEVHKLFSKLSQVKFGNKSQAQDHDRIISILPTIVKQMYKNTYEDKPSKCIWFGLISQA